MAQHHQLLEFLSFSLYYYFCTIMAVATMLQYPLLLSQYYFSHHFDQLYRLFNLSEYNLQQIFSYFSVYDLANMLLVCRLWKTKTPSYWSSLDFSRVYITNCARMLKLSISTIPKSLYLHFLLYLHFFFFLFPLFFLSIFFLSPFPLFQFYSITLTTSYNSLRRFVRHGTTGMTREELDAFSHQMSLVECVVPSSAAAYLVSPKVSKLTLLHR